MFVYGYPKVGVLIRSDSLFIMLFYLILIHLFIFILSFVRILPSVGIGSLKPNRTYAIIAK